MGNERKTQICNIEKIGGPNMLQKKLYGSKSHMTNNKGAKIAM